MKIKLYGEIEAELDVQVLGFYYLLRNTTTSEK